MKEILSKWFETFLKYIGYVFWIWLGYVIIKDVKDPNQFNSIIVIYVLIGIIIIMYHKKD